MPAMGDEAKDYLPGSQEAKVSQGEIYNALVEAEGNKAAAARALGVSRQYLVNKITANPVLTALCQDMVEEVIDHGEANVFKDVKNGDATATRFLLGTMGKARGWAAGVAGTGKDGEIVVQINRLSDTPPAS